MNYPEGVNDYDIDQHFGEGECEHCGRTFSGCGCDFCDQCGLIQEECECED